MVFSEDRIILQAGRKTFDVICSQGLDHLQFQLVERYRGITHKTALSFRELLWVCEWMDKAFRIRGNFWKKRQEKWQEIIGAKEANRSGLFLRVEVSGKGRSGAICFHVVGENCGWGGIHWPRRSEGLR